jgi:hypothetical protein
MASPIVDCRYALSERVSLAGAARGLPAWVAKTAIWWSRRTFAFQGPASQRAQDSGRL